MRQSEVLSVSQYCPLSPISSMGTVRGGHVELTNNLGCSDAHPRIEFASCERWDGGKRASSWAWPCAVAERAFEVRARAFCETVLFMLDMLAPTYCGAMAGM